MEAKFYTVKEAAESLGVTVRWIFKLIEKGKIKPIKIGGGDKGCGMNLIPRNQIEKLIKDKAK